VYFLTFGRRSFFQASHFAVAGAADISRQKTRANHTPRRIPKAPAAALPAATHRRTEYYCNRHRTKAAGQFTIVAARMKLNHVPLSFRMNRASTLA